MTYNLVTVGVPLLNKQLNLKLKETQVVRLITMLDTAKKSTCIFLYD